MRTLFLHYLTFFVVGGTGVLINLAITWGFTTFIFGLEQYFYAYLIGTTVNLIYIFALHTVHTFKTTHDHGKRFSLFILYHICMTAMQAGIIKSLTNLIGVQYYLLVIGGVIFVFSIVTFLIFRFRLFTQGPLLLRHVLGIQNENA